MTKLTEKIPYLRTMTYRFSSHTCQLLEKLTQTHGLYEGQLLEKIILDYARQYLPQDALDELFALNKKYTLAPSQFVPDRQLAVFDDVLSQEQVASLVELATVNEGGKTLLCIRDNETSHQMVRYLIGRVTQSYYCEMEGYFPSFFEDVEGYYLETVTPSCTEILNDVSDDNKRQLSFFIVLNGTDVQLKLIGSEDNDAVSLTPGRVILLPSNFSGSYQIIGSGGDVTFLKAYRCD